MISQVPPSLKVWTAGGLLQCQRWEGGRCLENLRDATPFLAALFVKVHARLVGHGEKA